VARNLFPAFLDFTDRRVLVVGGGNVASAKAARLVDAGARVVVVAPEIAPDLEHLPVTVIRRGFEPRDLDDCWYVVSAAPPHVNAEVVCEATARRIFVNAVDDPANATAFAGSGFKRGPVTVAISTGGDAPALARVMREALERLIGPEVEDWTSLAAKLRGEWKREGVPIEDRRDALLAALVQLERSAGLPPSPRLRRTRKADGHRGQRTVGFVSLVGAGPGDPELLTRLAARRLGDADLVLYDALVAPAAVSLATNAQRLLVGRRRGSETVGQDAIIRTMIRAARRGKRVVRLKGGDPFVFGRGGEEGLALAGAGIPFEIVPGVSSALAAPALASIPVTHRGLSSAFLVTSGHDPDRFASLANDIAPSSATLVVLMGTAQREAIVRALVDAGWSPSTPAAIIWNASHRDSSVWTGPLDALTRAVAPPDAPGTIVIGDVVALRDALIADLKPPQRTQNARREPRQIPATGNQIGQVRAASKRSEACNA
jgi:uroporphyrin-III C-methyltransferase/precorrin-2 dehydrogenase/sirohydrochlorin ferrochelatase